MQLTSDQILDSFENKTIQNELMEQRELLEQKNNILKQPPDNYILLKW